ncbi:MAG: hypothetical protein RL095_836 [Verrucomicrobiota bacterium]|jgi:biotin carboxylase
MRTPAVLFIGMARRGEFESLLARGIPLCLLLDSNSRHVLGDFRGFESVESFDFRRPFEELVAAVRAIQARRPLACLFNLGEYYVEVTSLLNAALGLPGLDPASVTLCQNKPTMRRRFHEIIGPQAAARFVEVHSEELLLEQAAVLGYPVFLQPANLAASMWCSCNNTPQELLAKYRQMLAEVPDYYAKVGRPDTRAQVVLAEFLQGDDHSVDCLAAADGRVETSPVVDVLKGRDIGVDDFHHFARIVPSRLGAQEQARLRELAAAGVRALGMRNSAAHVELIGDKLGEIAARPGGNRPRLLELAFGMDMIHATAQVLCGVSPDLRQTQQEAAAIVTPYARRQGTLKSIRHLEDLQLLPGYLFHEVRLQPGTAVGLAGSGYRSPLYIELQHPQVEVIRASVACIASWEDLYDVE